MSNKKRLYETCSDKNNRCECIDNYITELEAEKAELIEILKPLLNIIDKYELYNELSIELIYDKMALLLQKHEVK